jgi:hypothetical protein
MSLSLELLRKCAPKSVAKSITQDTVDTIVKLEGDEDFAEMYRENVIGYMNVLTDGRFKVEDYLNAVKYCSYKLMGDKNIQAFTKTFPAKYLRWVTIDVPEKQIHSYSTAYSKNKLVGLIMAQSIIPFHVYNQEARQQALNEQLKLMRTAKSEKVRSDAANSVLTHTKGPDEAKIEIDIAVKDTGLIDQIRVMTENLAIGQRQSIQSGLHTAKDMAHQSIIVEGEFEDVTD